MRVLVTGGTGYLGRAIVRALASAGHHPVVYSRTASASGLPGTPVDGDVRDCESLAAAAVGCGAVIHAAALVAVWRRDPAEFDDVNVGGLLNAIAAVEREGVLEALRETNWNVTHAAVPLNHASLRSNSSWIDIVPIIERTAAEPTPNFCVASTIVTEIDGRTMLHGIPGSPPPLPRSSSIVPRGISILKRGAIEWAMWPSHTLFASLREIRLIFVFHSRRRETYFSRRRTCSSVSSRPFFRQSVRIQIDGGISNANSFVYNKLWLFHVKPNP